MKKEMFLRQFPEELEYEASKLYNYFEISKEFYKRANEEMLILPEDNQISLVAEGLYQNTETAFIKVKATLNKIDND